MKFKKEEVKKIADLVVENLKKESLIEVKSGEGPLLEKIETILFQNMQEESDIEQETKKLMEQYRSQIASGSIDPQKVYTMIKKQVAKERKFVL